MNTGVKVLFTPLGPILVPLMVHWNNGVVPAFKAVAVNVADCPKQMVFPGTTAMVTLGVTIG